MSLAAVLAAAALAIAPHEPALELFRKLLRQDNPFASASRLADRTLTAKASADGAWRRYEGDGYFVELGPFAGRTPQKIVLTLRAPTRDAAVAYADRLFAAFPTAPQPRPPLQLEAPLAYRGAIVLARRPIGVELDIVEMETDWRVTVTLAAGGPRIVVPLGAPIMRLWPRDSSPASASCKAPRSSSAPARRICSKRSPGAAPSATRRHHSACRTCAPGSWCG